MMNQIKPALYGLFAVFVAANFKINPDDVEVPSANADETVARALGTAYFVAGLVAVVMIVIAGFMFVTSSGDANKVTRAKNMILGAVIGIVVIIAAASITYFVTSNIG